MRESKSRALTNLAIPQAASRTKQPFPPENNHGSLSRTRTYDRSVNSRLLYRLSYQGIKAGHKVRQNRQLPNLPGRLQPSTFGVWALNFCVRDGNRWATQPSPPDQLAQIPICFVVGARRSLRLRLRAFRLAYENLLCAVYVKDCSLKTIQEKKYRAFLYKVRPSAY